MNIDGFKKTKKIINSESDPLIRIMRDDMIALKKKKSNKKVSPPDMLPIVESIRNSEFKAQKESEIKVREEAERKKEAEEKVEKERIKAQKKAEEKVQEEAERQKELREKVEKERIKAQKEVEIKAREEAEKTRKIKEEEIKRTQRKGKIKEIKIKLIENAPKLIAGLIVVFLIIGIGIFFYWWNYVRVIPPVITHFECKNEQCVEIEGEGENQCELDGDCKPIIPGQLIFSYKIETIELSIEKYESFIDRFESIYRTKQEKNTFKSVLIKLIKQTKKEYADIYSFISISKINIPENIQNAIADSEINGDNYNLFLYNNGEENRAGLIISMKESSSLVRDLIAWEETIVADISSFIFKNEILEPATEKFQDNIYKGIGMRYMNFPTSDLSVDYAIIGDKLIITTSKDSMYAVIDDLIN